MKKSIVLSIFFTLALLLLSYSKVVFAEEKDISSYNTVNYSNFNIINENEFYCVNKINNKIEHYFNGIASYYGETGINNGQFSTIEQFKVIQNQTFCILDNIGKLHFFDENFNFINSVQYINYQNTYLPIGKITQIFFDIYSNVYLLDETNNFILKANQNSLNYEVYNTEFNISSTVATFLNNSNQVAIIKENNLICSSSTISLEETPEYIFSDAYDNIYLVYSNKIEKYNVNLTLVDTKIIEAGNNYNIDLENGDIFYILNNEIQKIENFAQNVNLYTPPVDFSNPSALSSPISLYTVNTEQYLLNNPYSIKHSLKLNKNDIVLLLGSTTNLETNFAYILYEKDGENYLGYIEQKFLTEINIPNVPDTLITVRNEILAYKYPILNKTNNISLISLQSNIQYTQTRIITINNISFVELKINNNYYYVFQNELISTSSKYINLYLQTNSKLNFFNSIKEIPLYNNENKDEIIYTITQEENIKVLKINSNMAEIEFIKENNIIKGFVEAKYLANNNNFTIPLTIMLSLFSLIILLVLIFKFKKDKHKV